jgi:hypothetical protein
MAALPNSGPIVNYKGPARFHWTDYANRSAPVGANFT